MKRRDSESTSAIGCVRTPSGRVLRGGSSVRVTVGALLLSASVGATSIKTLANDDPVMCARFKDLVEAAATHGMTDDNLCTFRFASLPTSASSPFGFSFPQWESMTVSDAAGTYSGMITADGNNHAREFDPPSQRSRMALDDKRQRLEVADLETQGILVFHKTSIPVSGHTLTFAQMDWTRCPRNTLMYAGALLYTAYRDRDLTEAIPSDASPLFAEIAIWNGSVPVAIEVNPARKDLGTEMMLTLTVLWWRESDKKREENGVLGGGDHCVFGLRN